MEKEFIHLTSAPIIGMLYHVSWGKSKGVVGKCMSIDFENKEVILRSPKSKINWKNPVKFCDLLLIRRQQINQHSE